MSVRRVVLTLNIDGQEVSTSVTARNDTEAIRLRAYQVLDHALATLGWADKPEGQES